MAQRGRTERQPETHAGAEYLDLSRRPLHVLVFLLPLLIAYELGAIVYLSSADEHAAATIAARRMLAAFFDTFGVVGLHLPAAALVTVLVLWHVLERDRWIIRPPVLLGMALEACIWTVPLALMAVLLVGSGDGPKPPPAAASLAQNIYELPWQARLTISAGAGIYEELLFRMIGIAAVHALLADVMRVKEVIARVAAVAVTAVAFMVYHGVGAGSLPPEVSAFYLLSGVYFGTLFLIRGFGLAVAVHALYDTLALVGLGG